MDIGNLALIIRVGRAYARPTFIHANLLSMLTKYSNADYDLYI